MDEQNVPKKKNLFLRLLAFLVTLALVVGAVFLIANRDKLNLDNLRRYFTYRSLERSDSGQAESFPYSGSATDIFVAVENDLLVCSTGGVRLYSGGGVCYIEETFSLEKPAVEVNGTTIAAYSVGGDTIYLYRDRTQYGILDDLTGSILSVRLNSSGWIAVTTKESGYKAIVTVYDNELEKRMAFRLSSAFVTDAVVTEDCSSLAMISVGQKGTAFESTLSFYALPTSKEAGVDYDLTPASTLSLGNNVPLTLRANDAIWCVGDTGVSVYSNGVLGSRSYQESQLKRYALSDRFTAVLVGKYRAGTQSELHIIDAQGNSSATRVINEQVLSLSAAGRYIAVLTANRLDIYTQNLELYASLSDTDGAKTVLMRNDGTALLVGNDTAHLFVPN